MKLSDEKKDRFKKFCHGSGVVSTQTFREAMNHIEAIEQENTELEKGYRLCASDLEKSARDYQRLQHNFNGIDKEIGQTINRLQKAHEELDELKEKHKLIRALVNGWYTIEPAKKIPNEKVADLYRYKLESELPLQAYTMREMAIAQNDDELLKMLNKIDLEIYYI